MEILPDRCVQIAKRELMFAGSVGLVTYLGGVIYINRKRTSDAKSIMAGVAKAMKDDNVSTGGCEPRSPSGRSNRPSLS